MDVTNNFILQGLVNGYKLKLNMVSTDTVFFFPNYFNLHLIESMEAESMRMGSMNKEN